MKINRQPFFSIITVTYNVGQTIEHCLSSLFNQTERDYELLIIDGASTDNTLDILKKYSGRISFLSSEKDRGIYDAMNKGLRRLTGKYVFFLNADDAFFDHQVLARVKRDIEYHGYPDVFSAKVHKDYPTYTAIRDSRLSAANLRRGKMPPHQGTFVRTKFLNHVGTFDSSFRSSGDFELTCRLFLARPRYYFDNLVICHFASGGMSSRKDIAYQETVRAIRQHFGPFPAAQYYLEKFIEQLAKRLLLILRLREVTVIIQRYLERI